MTQEEETNKILIEIEAIIGRVNADLDRLTVLLKRLTSPVEIQTPPNKHAVRARYGGVCYECELSFYVGDWIVIQNVDGMSAAIHAEHIKP